MHLNSFGEDFGLALVAFDRRDQIVTLSAE